MSIQGALSKKKWAVIGANNNPDKNGYKVFTTLKDSGYEVYPINPKYDKIENEVCYSSLEELPEVPDVVSFVVEPKVGYNYIDQVKKMDIKCVWFQPDTVDNTILEKLKDSDIEVIQGCVMKAGLK